MINLFWRKAKRNSDSKQEKEKKQPYNTAYGFTFLEKKIIIPRTGRVRTRLRHSVSIVPFGCLTTAALLPTACNTLKLLETIRRAMPTSDPAPSHLGALGPSKTQYFTAKRKHYKSDYTVTGSRDCCVTVVMALQNRETCTETQSESWHFDHWSQIGRSVARSSPSAYQQRRRQTCKQWASDAANAKTHDAARAPARKAHWG